MLAVRRRGSQIVALVVGLAQLGLTTSALVPGADRSRTMSPDFGSHGRSIEMFFSRICCGVMPR